MTFNDYESTFLTLKEQFEDDAVVDTQDIRYLFEIISILEQRIDMYEVIIRENRHVK